MKFITFDPGESTGYSVWDGSELVYAGTCSLEEAQAALGAALGATGPAANPDPELVHRFEGAGLVVIEDWAIYPWEAQNLAWDACRTARGIGAMEYICLVSDTPYRLQPAKIKQKAVAAGAEEHFLRPLHENRHANDAIMHGVVARVEGAVS